MPLARRSPGAPRATLLVTLLLATLALAALLAWEAHDAVRAHRATAERAVRDYAALSAWELLAGATQVVDTTLAEAVRPVTQTRAASPWEALPALAVLGPTAARVPRCAGAADSVRALFRLGLPDGTLAIAPDPAPGAAARAPAAALQRWVADTVAAHARATYQAGARYALLVGAGAWRDVAIVYGVRDAQFGAPLAAYGVVTCTAALGAPLFGPALRAARAGSAPASDSAGAAQPPLPDDSLLALAVLAPDGRELYRTAHDAPGPAAAESRVAGLTVRAALRPTALARLVPPPPPATRLPLLAGLLGLTALLAVAALLLLRREQELARLRADFTSSVSHELRTPLAQILLFGETLSMDRVRSDAERRLAVDTIVQETRRLIHMVENVLHFARAERGIERLALRRQAVGPLVRDALRAFAPLAESAGATLEATVDDAAAAEVDAAALRQVLLNLLDNAVKYGPMGQAVTVSVLRAGDRVRVQVDDQGPGVPPHDRERVWIPFVRLARHDARGGSGIGLAVVRELVELHGGAAFVERAPGGGARFVVELPAAAAEEMAPARGPAPNEARGAPPEHHDGRAGEVEHHHASANGSESSPAAAGARGAPPEHHDDADLDRARHPATAGRAERAPTPRGGRVA